MSETTGPDAPGPHRTLFAYALRLHRQYPHSPLPRDGKPYPDDDRHGRQWGRKWDRRDQRLVGADVAAILDRHFSRPDAPPRDLVDAFHDVDVPIHHNPHITAAALRADRQRVRQTGRWLVRHSTDRCAATVGLALLATDWTPEDIPLIQTIGLLSNWFGPLAAEALRRRHDGGEEALTWLAQRAAGWGRVYVIEALCAGGASAARQWLLRHACDGDYLNGYFAGQVATAAHLHAAIVADEVDDDLVDHTGHLLKIMAGCGGMGLTLEHYPPAPAVLAAHVTHLARQTPTVGRYVDAATIADQLADRSPQRSGCGTAQRDELVRRYLAVLDRQDWCDTVRAGLDQSDEFVAWFVANVAARLRLRAFADPTGDD
ncbi:hypothetical protein [Micromonospora auratinigra]|uniref:Uncharacterized protein n=1 Tax=Micromonospora auratinigra TaxID=261654 RepID=A0A1A8Z5G4_9ACTN|nr:hypothetical protein [Micromonospora auratinigra]SBT39036.1 hypothetical protein GA0070611_0763 [Micromonospora auratinigra]